MLPSNKINSINIYQSINLQSFFVAISGYLNWRYLTNIIIYINNKLNKPSPIKASSHGFLDSTEAPTTWPRPPKPSPCRQRFGRPRSTGFCRCLAQIHRHLYIFTCIFILIYLLVSIYICMCVCECVYEYMCICIYLYVCVSV